MIYFWRITNMTVTGIIEITAAMRILYPSVPFIPMKLLIAIWMA